MKVVLLVIVLLGGFAVCATLLGRSMPRPFRPLPPVQPWPRGIRRAPAGDERPDGEADGRTLEKLWREEARQRPQEGRN